jgi:hypothetical protein
MPFDSLLPINTIYLFSFSHTQEFNFKILKRVVVDYIIMYVKNILTFLYRKPESIKLI